MRSCGQGFSSIEKFVTLMNMPTPVTKKSYNEFVKLMTEVVCTVANESMVDAARDIKNKADNPDVLVDTGVSVDGTWQRRGFASFNGNVAAISIDNGKVLDIE